MTKIIFASLPYFIVVGAFAYVFYQGINEPCRTGAEGANQASP
jgi:hypothetical protein